MVQNVVNLIASRTALQTEADIQSNVATLLEHGDLNLTEHDVVKREAQVGGGTRHRIDVEMGHLVIEVKRDLRPGRVLPDAEQQLAGYLTQREAELGGSFAGVLTDGTGWRLYRLASGACELVATMELSESAPDADRLVVWLESIMATRTQVKPTLTTIEELLGATSPAHGFDHAVLRGMLDAAAGDPEVALKRELWSKLLKTAYGDAFSDDVKLFVNHTLLVITAEAIAHAIVGFDLVHGLSVDDLVSGAQFSRRQIHGVVEQDFFDWPVTLPGGHEFVADVARRVARFDWSAVEHDVLKVLYESVIEQRDRRDLGEYYTPDWLAEVTVADRVTDPLKQRVLDPSCGSGTFVFHAVKAHLAAADADGIGLGAGAVSAAAHVFGIDIHPVAVTLARVTYLMALGTDRLNAADRGPLRIPVFLGDSLQWERHQDLFTDDQAITIATSSEDLIEGGGGSLFADDLVFPAAVWADGNLFDALVNDMAVAVLRAAETSTKSTAQTTKKAMTPILTRRGVTDPRDQNTLIQTFETWVGLQRSQRDRIWGYYVRNLAKPVWLALTGNRVDVLVGNPPWLRYSKMTEAMQRRYKELAKPRNLLTGGLGASARDLSTLFVARTIELYLKDGGQFGFVMPFGALSRRPHTGFRAGNWNSVDSQGLLVHFDEPWDLSAVRDIFPMTSCVVRGRHSTQAGAMPATATPWVAPRNGQPAHPLPPRPIAAIDAGSGAESPYETLFRDGAILYPRLLIFVDTITGGPLAAGAGQTEVTSARSNQEKPPWKSRQSLSGIVEDRFVTGVHLGETIVPFRALKPRPAVLPVSASGILTESEIADFPGLSEWWTDVEDAWVDGRVATESAPLRERMDFHGQLTAQFPVRSDRVVYTKSGNTLAAARLPRNDESLIDHVLYWASCSSAAEAHYLVAVLNSRALLEQVAQYQAVGNFGARHFDKYVFRVGIPMFNPSEKLHQELAVLASTAEELAAQVNLPAGIRFTAARRMIVDRLTVHGVQGAIERAVTILLSVSS